MNSERRASLGIGLVLILLGAWFLIVQFVPSIGRWVEANFDWPFFVIGAGLLLMLIGLLVGAPGMAIPAAIVSGIGCLLWWQNSTGNWESWAYAWTLIPGFVGVGMVVAGLLGENPRRTIRDGLSAILTSLVLFAIFASFLGGWNLLGQYWPVLLILLGLWLLAGPILRRRPS